MTFEISDRGKDGDWTFVRDQLRAYNIAIKSGLFDPDADEPRIDIYLRDADGQIIGGILCEIHWQSLMIEFLWVADRLRGQGLGKELLRRAETLAREQGCLNANLSTFDFQAPEFYQRHGFRMIGQMDDYPPGHRWFLLRHDFE
jgi:GNAT superfamily N-acetyltransferase